jgi:hypothetical protein
MDFDSNDEQREAEVTMLKLKLSPLSFDEFLGPVRQQFQFEVVANFCLNMVSC